MKTTKQKSFGRITFLLTVLFGFGFMNTAQSTTYYIDPEFDANYNATASSPVHDFIRVEVPEQSTIRIIDVLESQIVGKTIVPGATEIPLNVNPGLYLVEISGKNNYLTANKVIV
jgi:hypothetical protein